MKITTEDLQKLLDDVTPGEWMVDYPNNCDVVCDGLEIATTHPDVLSGSKPTGSVPQHNATLIALSPAIASEIIAIRASAEKSAAMATAAKAMIAAYDEWCECVSGTPEDTIACGTMLARSYHLRNAIAAYEAQQ